MKALILSLVFVVCMCTTKKVDPPVLGPEPEPNIIVKPGQEKCGDACQNMANLGCEEAEPVGLEDGGSLSCTDMCVYDHNNGIEWNTDCLVVITCCSQIDSCFQ